MNIYQVTLNHNDVLYPHLFQDLILKDPNVNAWWNYLPNVFLIRTNQPAKYFADNIIRMYPGVKFLITKIDLNEYNGYLPQKAWDWIKAHSQVKYLKIKPNPQAPTYGDALKRAIEFNAEKEKQTQSFDALLEAMKRYRDKNK